MKFETGYETFKLGVYGLLSVLSVGFIYGALNGLLVPSFTSTVLYRLSLAVLGLLVGSILVWTSEFISGMDRWKQAVVALLLAYFPYLVIIAGLLEMAWSKIN